MYSVTNGLLKLPGLSEDLRTRLYEQRILPDLETGSRGLRRPAMDILKSKSPPASLAPRVVVALAQLLVNPEPIALDQRWDVIELCTAVLAREAEGTDELSRALRKAIVDWPTIPVGPREEYRDSSSLLESQLSSAVAADILRHEGPDLGVLAKLKADLVAAEPQAPATRSDDGWWQRSRTSRHDGVVGALLGRFTGFRAAEVKLPPERWRAFLSDCIATRAASISLRDLEAMLTADEGAISSAEKRTLLAPFLEKASTKTYWTAALGGSDVADLVYVPPPPEDPNDIGNYSQQAAALVAVLGHPNVDRELARELRSALRELEETISRDLPRLEARLRQRPASQHQDTVADAIVSEVRRSREFLRTISGSPSAS
jgi:hypothetical protein